MRELPNLRFHILEAPDRAGLSELCGLLVMANKRQVQCVKCEKAYVLDEIIPETARE